MVIFFTPILARGFEHVDRALDVDALVKRRLGEAGPHARARREVDDLVEFDRGKNFVERGAVRDVAVDKFKRCSQWAGWRSGDPPAMPGFPAGCAA